MLDDDGLGVVGGAAVGDDDDVDGLHVLHVLGVARQALEVGLENVLQSRARGRRGAGPHALEELLDLVGALDVVVAPRCLSRGRGPRRAVVEEVEIDAVGVVVGADGRDGPERVAGLPPGSAGHAAAVVDDEDGVKGGQEGILVLGGGYTGDTRYW